MANRLHELHKIGGEVSREPDSKNALFLKIGHFCLKIQRF